MNEDLNVTQLGDHLLNKKVAILVCGSIAAYKVPGIIRQFRRYGANLTVYLTDDANEFVGIGAIKWAIGKPDRLITRLSESADHLNQYDIYVVVPATYNTINKFYKGIADTVVTTTLAAALGRLEAGKTTIFVMPTMNGDMMNSIYRESVLGLSQKGVKIIPPIMENNKANIQTEEFIVGFVAHHYNKDTSYVSKGLPIPNVLVTGGPVGVRIDNRRRLVADFGGLTGVEISKEAFLRGMDVTYVYGKTSVKPPTYIYGRPVGFYEMYLETVLSLLDTGKFTHSIFSAAVADYMPDNVYDGKIPSGLDLNIHFKATQKVIDLVQARYKDLKMVTFKFQEGISVDELLKIATNRIDRGYFMVVANRGEDMTECTHRSYLVQKNSRIVTETKRETAKTIVSLL